MKGDASSVIFVLVAIGMIVGATIIIFWKWNIWQGGELSQAACSYKQQSYCVSLINGENPNWNDIDPKTGCEKYNIAQPSLDDCKGLKK